MRRALRTVTPEASHRGKLRTSDQNTEIVLKSGNTRQQIATTIRERKVDLVILGAHILGSSRLISGSTAEPTRRMLPTAIMTVRKRTDRS